ncbi:MAG: glutathionylspermidine synthase family protein [Lagierella massiliensis]|nr:glutathionylspermidine synthase family protein [Lagierella massiliensis]
MYNSKYVKEYVDIIKKDTKKYYHDYLNMLESVKNSNAYCNNKPVPTLYQGLFYDGETKDNLNKISKTLMKITRKVTNHYLESEEYRKLFNFSKELENLILHDPGYDIPVPICRYDIFYNSPEKFKFVEFNTDGSSAMNEDNEIGPILLNNLAMKELSKSYKMENVDLINSWVKASLNIYSRHKNNKPNVAIVDFLDLGTSIEFKAFKKAYENAGVNCEVVDIRDLEYSNGKLHKGDYIIDLVYRRAVTVEIMKRFDEIKNFIKAYYDNAFMMLGSFRSQIMHIKPIFEILLKNETKSILNDDEIKFLENSIPKTFKLETREDFDEVLNHKDDYILKPTDSYASQGIYAGREHTKEDFKKILTQIIEKDYIYQEYYDMDPLDFVEFENEKNLKVSKFGVVLGMFIYDEKFIAPYTRIGKESLISGARSYYTAANILINEKDE